MSADVTIFSARKIITMDASVPEATHVAVRDGTIVELGSREECAAWGNHTFDDRFDGSILVPGLIESHAHLMEGLLWAEAEYVGAIDRRSPNGTRCPGLRSISALTGRLQEIEAKLGTTPEKPMLGWGVDPSFYHPSAPITRQDLDRVSKARPIFLLNASGHIGYVNSKALELAGYNDLVIEGVVRDPAGKPTGELQEIAAMMPAVTKVARTLIAGSTGPEQFFNFARVAQARGITTVVDGGASPLFDPTFLEAALRATSDAAFPARIVAHGNGITVPRLETMLRNATALNGQGNEKFGMQGIKIVLDGSIQGFTGRLRPPGYFLSSANGLWNRPPPEVREIVCGLHKAGLQVVAHCNGDQAAEVFIDAVAAAMNQWPRFDHRHFIVHGQMLDEALLRRMAALGMGATLFSNHMYYWGDFHREQTVGPFRAAAMNPAATALRLGITVAGHSDTPVSPIDPLMTMWCAANRVTSSGRVLGPSECVSPYHALRMMTVNAAWLLHRDHEIGSIRVGKRADFTLLAENPLEVAPVAIKDIRVLATVLGGQVFPVPD